jgi:hypothetical protein
MTGPKMPGQARYGEAEEEQLKQEIEEEGQRQQDYSKDDEDRLQTQMEVIPETNAMLRAHATPPDHTTPRDHVTPQE